MAILTDDATSCFTCKDNVTGIIFVAWTNSSEEVFVAKLTPDGTKLEFSDGSTEKMVEDVTASAVAIAVKNSILCLKYIDEDGALQQKFSKDTGETWEDTF